MAPVAVHRPGDDEVVTAVTGDVPGGGGCRDVVPGREGLALRDEVEPDAALRLARAREGAEGQGADVRIGVRGDEIGVTVAVEVPGHGGHAGEPGSAVP
ncbi:UNVERIFIED_CONTAM: hypothetical protein RKD43_005942 [Streptomyces graminofaciens]